MIVAPATVSPEKTPPQVLMTVGDDGTLSKPTGQTTNFYKKVREMRRDPTVSLARALSVAPILAGSWSFESERDAPFGAKEMITEIMTPMRMQVLRSAMLGCADFGWQPYEKVMMMDDQGNLVLKKLKPLLQDLCTIMVNPLTGDYVGLQCDSPSLDEPIFLEVEETLLLNIDVEGTNWYGESLMKAVEAQYDKAVEVDKAATRYDRKIAGAHWVVYYPWGTSKVDGQTLDNSEVAKRLLARLEAAGSIAVPRTVSEIVDSLNKDAIEAQSWKIELMNASGGTTPFIERLKYLDAMKARCFGMPERAILEGQFGTKAEAEAHADFSITNMELRSLMIHQQVNWHVVNHLLRVNYGKEAENSVYIKPSPITDTSLSYIKTVYDKILASPSTGPVEMANIDTEAMKDRLGIPVLPQMDVDNLPADVQAVRDQIIATIQQPALDPEIETLQNMIIAHMQEAA